MEKCLEIRRWISGDALKTILAKNAPRIHADEPFRKTDQNPLSPAFWQEKRFPPAKRFFRKIENFGMLVKKLAVICLPAVSLFACVPFDENLTGGRVSASSATDEPRLTDVQQLTLNKYFQAYKNKDVDAILALFDEDILGALYPDTVFGVGIDAARPGIEGDYAARPNAYAVMPDRYRIAADKWMTAGQSINGDTRAPLWILFDLNETGDKIEATYTQIGWSGMIDGISVAEPTQMMRGRFNIVFDSLAEADFSAAAAHFADDAALFQFPPADIADYGPIITGASDVASVLAFKWGEGAWKANAKSRRYMQFVFVGIPGGASGNALDRYLVKQGLTNEKFAVLMEADASAVALWRRGEALPSEGQLKKLRFMTNGQVAPEDLIGSHNGALDRVALFTFDADPASPSYEKIIRVDVMGPSGG